MPKTMTEPSKIVDQKANRAAAVRQRRGARAIAADRQRKQSLVKRIAIAVAVVIVVAIVGYFLYQRQQSQLTQSDIPAGTVSYNYTGAQHSTAPVKYTENPPVGGVHNPTWQNCGYYAKPLHNENAVHALEHGAIWITYQPDLPQDQVDKLKSLAESQSYILVSPYPGIPTPVVASAWNRQLQLQSVDDPRLDQFVRRFRLSQEAPEPGAPCSGGTSATQ
jgi:hypothetical protein